MRREPPAFRDLTVIGTVYRTPHLVRVTLSGPGLQTFEPPDPAGSVRLLIPDELGGELVIPVWNGNAFFHRDGRRPVLRTLTPLRHDASSGELDVDIVVHGTAPLSEWAVAARPGDPAAVSGPGRGYSIDVETRSYLVAGDESAIPAIGQLVDALPATARTTVIVEVARPEARVAFADRVNVEVQWVDLPPGAEPGVALVPAVLGSEITTDETRRVGGRRGGRHAAHPRSLVHGARHDPLAHHRSGLLEARSHERRRGWRRRLTKAWVRPHRER